MVYGEQRGTAVCDYDHDGRPDLVVTENSAATRLFHNVNGKPGIRVVLSGPAGNPSGIGAQLRLKTAAGWGPAREVHGGSGYWSQDGAVQVISGAGKANKLQVRWPGGKESMVEVPSEAKELRAQFEN